MGLGSRFLAHDRPFVPYPLLEALLKFRFAPVIWSSSLSKAEQMRRVRVAGWLCAIGFGLLHSWVYLHDIRDVDGVSYLDMGDAMVRGDWATAVNTYWSPLYAAILGLAMAVLRPAPAWEYAVTQAVNFTAYLWALACFDFFLVTLLKSRREAADAPEESVSALPGWALFAIGYPVFIWSALYWHYFWLQSPDMIVAGLVFLAAAILLRIHRGPTGWIPFVALGCVLGLAYLSKAALFPLSFVFLAVAALVARRFQPGLIKAAAAMIVFLVIAFPWVLALSVSKQKLTFGESGRLNYAWFVNRAGRISHWPHWYGQAGYGTPIHPSRRILDEPAVYEFASPIGGSYPMWYDPSYWHEGLEPRFELRAQVKRLVESAKFYYELFSRGPQPGLLVAAITLYVLGSTRRTWWRSLLRDWPLYVPAVAALAMYSLVYVEGRYVAPFVLLLWFGALAGVRVRPGLGWERAGVGAAIGVALLTLAQISWSTAMDIGGRGSVRDFDGQLHSRVAERLWSVGVQPGDRIGVVGSGLNAARWARLARVKVIAEMPKPSQETFWNAGMATELRVVEAFCSTGANGIVAQYMPEGALGPEWTSLSGIDGYAYRRCERAARRSHQDLSARGGSAELMEFHARNQGHLPTPQ